ncbi:hypothetical protein Pmani_002436 [Petrolisthes manimaculis]|uniref:Uncharacterized protein n=1 Tax=Petrolisthes manimaculis TaxID=1843537 RepID=A0AAE1UKD0_9EUCA|nr:hypothetical protein Pmani_002436 [Petrolisthes manimaculis]
MGFEVAQEHLLSVVKVKKDIQCAMASVSRGAHTYTTEAEADGVLCYLGSPDTSPHLALRAVAGSPQVTWSSQVSET